MDSAWDWYVTAIRKYAVFDGRAGRSEYWYFVLVYFGISIVLGFIDGMFGAHGMGLLSAVFCVAMVIPSLSIAIRRLHDTDRSAWWLLIGFVPVAGIIILIVFFASVGTQGSNRYGAPPEMRPMTQAAA